MLDENKKEDLTEEKFSNTKQNKVKKFSDHKLSRGLFTILFWIISLTWGALLSYIGLLICLFLTICGYKPKRNGCTIIIEIGKDWGGLELGCVALCEECSETDKYGYEHIRRHEFGHNLQQLVFGPFQLFISIASAIRYWIRVIQRRKGKQITDYDNIWFEYTASKFGYKYVNWLERVNDFEYKYVRPEKNVKTYIYYRNGEMKEK